MTKEETISNLKAYLDGDTAIGNIIPLRSVLESAIKYLEPSLPSNLGEAAEEIVRDWLAYGDGEFEKLVISGAEWMAGQGCTVEIDEGYFINNPHNNRKKGKFHKYYSSVFGHSKKITVTPGDNLVVQIRKKQ